MHLNHLLLREEGFYFYGLSVTVTGDEEASAGHTEVG